MDRLNLTGRLTAPDDAASALNAKQEFQLGELNLSIIRVGVIQCHQVALYGGSQRIISK